MTHTSGYVAVGTGERIEWSTKVGVLYWVVAGSDQRVVTQLSVGMFGLLGDASRDDAVMQWDEETGKWWVRGAVSVEKGMLEKLEVFALLVESERGR